MSIQNKKPLVSILTPCYNAERFIENYIKKIIKQTYDNIELVFINDGSVDKTEEIIKKKMTSIKKRGYKVIYYKKSNGGLGFLLLVRLR